MSLKLKVAAVIAAGAMLSMSARADEASKREKLHEMFRLAHTDQTMNQIYEAQKRQLPQIMHQMLPGVTLTPEQQKQVDAFMVKVQGIVQSQASWSKLEPQFTEIYASVYSESEVDGLIAFYKSPVGVEMVAKQPLIVAKSQAVTQDLLQQVQPQLVQAMTQFLEQIKAGTPAGAAK